MVGPNQASQSDEGTEREQEVKAQQPRQRISDFPKDLRDMIYPALPIGGLLGASGILFGGVTGILRATKYPVVVALTTGAQFATFGTVFDASRTSMLHYFGTRDVTPREKVQASAAAGAISGALASTIRGSIRAIPAAAIYTVFGATGQWVYNRNEERNMNRLPDDENVEKHPWLNSKWSPMKVLSEEEYNGMLQEKLLNVNAQIALIDESIQALRRQEREEVAKGISESDKPKPDLN